MATELDLPTILFLQKTSYIAGALTLCYLRLTSSESRGVGLLALSFVMLAAGSTLAGYAELHPAFYGMLSLVNIAMGVLGYSLLGLAFVLISNPGRQFDTWLVLLPALGTVLVGLVTNFHLDNTYRATTFTLLGCLTTAAAAWVVYRDADGEALPVRKLVAGTLAAVSLLCLILAVEFWLHAFPVLSVVSGFFLMIVSKFVLAIAIVIFINERQHLKIKQLADHDPLTGVFNRRAFDARSPSELAKGDAVLFLDIDHFKQLNDRFGHAAGDRVLSTMAQAVQSVLPEGALFGRQGGEEFIVFLPQSAGDAILHAERIRKTVADLRFPDAHAEIAVTLSIGVATASRHASNICDLSQEADKALYVAKANGRNRVCGADPNDLPQAMCG